MPKQMTSKTSPIARPYHRNPQGQAPETRAGSNWPEVRAFGPGIGLVLIALLATRLPIWFAGANVHLSIFMDDAGYYLEAARRSVEARSWPSMDGVERTNGFHPLYMLLLVVIQAVLGTDPRIVIPVVMAFQLAIGAIATILLAREAALRDPKSWGLWVGLPLALDPGWMEHGLCGVESGISSLLVLVAALRWESHFVIRPQTSNLRSWAFDGLLLGLAMAARTDSALFAFTYLTLGAWRNSRLDGPQRALMGAGVATCAALLVLAPWLISNLLRFGTLRQDSTVALATRFAAQDGSPFSLTSLRAGLTTLGFWWIRILWSTGLVPLTGWGLGLAIPLERWRSVRFTSWIPWGVAAGCGLLLFLRGNDTLDIGSVSIAIIEAGLGGLALLGGLCTARSRDDSSRPLYTMLALYAFLTISAYSFGFRAFQPWYSTAVCLTAVLLPLGRTLAPFLVTRRALGSVLLTFMAVQSFLLTRELLICGGREGMNPRLLAEGEHLRAKLEEFTATTSGKARFGSFDSGKLSYRTHPFPITNVDGVMNHRAAEALTKRQLDTYFADAGITYLIGEPSRIADFAAISPFQFAPDSSLTRYLEMPVSRVLPSRKAR